MNNELHHRLKELCQEVVQGSMGAELRLVEFIFREMPLNEYPLSEIPLVPLPEKPVGNPFRSHE